MVSQNLPAQKDNSFIDKLKRLVNQYIGGNSDVSSQIIQSAIADSSMLPEMKSAAASIFEKEARRIKTRKRIVEKAASIKTNDETVSEEKPADDWMARFFNTVEDITEDTMQNLWAQILAGEVKRPHSFSLRTLDILRNMTKEDAELYVKAVESYCYDGYILTDEEYGISLEDRITLSEMGVLSPDELTRTISINGEQQLDRLNDGYALVLKRQTANKIDVTFNCRSLTKAGRELLPLVNDKNNLDKFAYIAGKFKKAGINSVALHQVKQWKKDGTVSYIIVPEKVF